MATLSFSWRKLDINSDILPRSSHDISVVDNIAYLFGGENVPRTPIDSSVLALDMNQLAKGFYVVECHGNPPTPRLAHAQAVIGKKLYFFGGRLSVSMDDGALDDLYSFDTLTSTWEGPVVASNPPPIARSFHKMISIGDSLYVFAGCAIKDRLNDLFEYNTVTNTWTQLPSTPLMRGRGGPNIAASNDGLRIYVAAGYSGEENNDVYVYNIASQSWKQLASNDMGLYRARSVCASCRLLGHMVIVAGEVNTSELGHAGAGDFTSDIVTISTDSNESCLIKTHPPAPEAFTPRGWFAMAPLNDTQAVLFGGLAGNDDNPIRLNDTWIIEASIV